MKKMTKIASIVLVVLMLAMISTNVFAVMDPGTLQGTPGENTGKLTDFGKQIIGILQVIGSILCVVVLVIIGIKYIMGSAEEKAEYKKTMIPYIIGAVLVFAAPFIAGLVYSFANNIK